MYNHPNKMQSMVLRRLNLDRNDAREENSRKSPRNECDEWIYYERKIKNEMGRQHKRDCEDMGLSPEN